MRHVEKWIKLLALCLLACGLASCQTGVPVDGASNGPPPARFVQVARVNAQGAEHIRKELVHWGIPSEINASSDLICRIMVHPGFRFRALAVLHQLESKPKARGFGIRYD